MNSLASIRKSLQMTQAAMAEVLEVTQGNVSFYENGQTIPPKVAARLIEFARTKGRTITYDEIYAAPSATSEQAG